MKMQSNGSTVSKTEHQEDITNGEPHDEYYFERQTAEQNRITNLQELEQACNELSEGIFEEWLVGERR